MAELSPWQRNALDFLAEKPGGAPGSFSTMEGVRGLQRKGLAEQVSTFGYRLTDAGVAEHIRRHRKDAA